MSTPKTFVSSTGTLGAQPLSSRISSGVSDFGSLIYLFVETIVSPIFNPGSWADPAVQPIRRNPDRRSGGSTLGGGGRPGGGGGGGGGGSGGGGGGGGGGGRGGGGGGGFMSMSDLHGGGTVDGCRATCG